MLEALNIRTAARLVSELGIHVFSKFFSKLAETGSTDRGDVLLKGVRLEDPVSIQSVCPFSSWRLETLFAGAR